MKRNVFYYQDRNVAIDMLRALTMCLMIFVNHLWTIHGVPHWMDHAESMEDFLGLADFVYPAFLFVMGMSIPYSVEKRIRDGQYGGSILLHILKRGFSLVLMGVLMVNEGKGTLDIGPWSDDLYPILMVAGFFLLWNDYGGARPLTRKLLRLLGAALLAWMVLRFRTADGRLMQARWWGILGLLGWAYMVCAILYFMVRDRLEVHLPVWGFFILLCILFTDTRGGDAVLDLGRGSFIESLRSSLHFGNGSDQALTMGGMILTIVGVRYASRWKPTKRVLAGLCAGAVLTVLGALSHCWFITSKDLATLPWVLWSTALCVILYTLLQILVRHKITGWYKVVSPAGNSTLTAYVVPVLLEGGCSLTGLHLWDRLSGLPGMLYLVVYVAFVLAVTYGLGRLHVRLKL